MAYLVVTTADEQVCVLTHPHEFNNLNLTMQNPDKPTEPKRITTNYPLEVMR